MKVSRFKVFVVVVLLLTVSQLAFASRRRSVGSTPAHQFEGTLTDVGTSSITIHDSHGNDTVIQLTDKTFIFSGNKTLKATDLKTGMQVHVSAIQDSTEAWIAQRVIVQEPENDQAQDVEITGTVKSVGTSSLVVTTSSGDVTVNVDTNTVIREKGQIIQLSDIKVGDTVEASGTQVDATTILAKRITVQAPENDAGEIGIQGTVMSVGTSSLTVQTSSGLFTVNVDSNTVIKEKGQTIQLSDIHIGDTVEAEGTSIDATTILAKSISVEAPEAEEMEIAGTVKSVGTSSLVVTTSTGDITVNVDSNTTIKKGHTTIQLSDIKVGDKVEADGTKVDATTMLAKKISVED